MRQFARLCLGVTLGLVPATAASCLDVKEVGSFYVGGETTILSGLPMREIVFTQGAAPFKSDPNGDFEVGQMYVHFVRLESPRARYPLLMWHGGGLTGVTWESTPDGRPGWEMFFLRAGHDVYVSDQVERGRASWARYPEIYKTEPFFRTKKEAWELFRLGPKGSYTTEPSTRTANAGVQFPIGSIDNLVKESVPRWATNDAAAQKAYNEYVQKVCPCVLLIHSAAGAFAFKAALAAPDKIKAIIAVEPSGAPDPATVDLAKLKNIPMLAVWGDYFEGDTFWQKLRATPTKFLDALKEAGGHVDVIDLPKQGIHGNTHMIMMDKNSDQIADLIEYWIKANGLIQ